ncbi:MAG TPA: germination protein YpeB [Candidatus Eubacterium faecigallinarum]|nr:germination protein YpeB [Candidatus Eubacterium faecigallinarum]
MKLMTKRGYIRLFSYSIAIVAVLAGFAIVNMNMAANYKAQLENNYQQSLNELSETMDSIETNLTKSIYSNSDKMLYEISSDLYSECTKAKDALSRLPVGQMNLSSTYKFISQASDYATYIAQKTASGETVSQEEHNNLSTLLNYATQLNDSISSMVSVCNNGGLITASNVKNENNVTVNSLTNDMTTAESAFKDYPTLLYDGPFADAVLNRESQMLKDAEAYSKDDAADIAAYAMGCSYDQVSFQSEEDGNVPCYVFSYGQKTVGITKNGGYVAYMLYGGKITKSTITEENAVNIAKDYLEKLGYENMTETYYMTDNNVCVINFAYSVSGVIYYSDLIKVGVSMNNGEVVSIEAKGFLVNHRDRAKFSADKTQEELQKNISPYLTVMNVKKCVIPKDNGTEANCYEFHCESNETNEEVLIYVNTDTGAEENILLLLYSDGGTLTK